MYHANLVKLQKQDSHIREKHLKSVIRNTFNIRVANKPVISLIKRNPYPEK